VWSKRTWKLTFFCFEAYDLLNFKALAAKTRNFHGLKIIFLESTINRLYVDASSFHNKRVFEHKKYVFPAAWSKRTWKLTFFCFEPYDLLNFKALAAKTRIFHGLKIIFLESTINRLYVDASFFHNKRVFEHKK
jgi:hypothetical protein